MERRVRARLTAQNAPEIPELDRRGLRDFGLVTGGILAGLFGLLFPWLLTTGIPLWPWIIGGTLALCALVAPSGLRPLHYWWMRFALLLSRITTPIILGVVFFLVILPVALIMKIVRRDTMARRFDERATSYRVPSPAAARQKMERPF